MSIFTLKRLEQLNCGDFQMMMKASTYPNFRLMEGYAESGVGENCGFKP